MNAQTPLAKRAGILCNDRQFRDYVARCLQVPGPVNVPAAAHYLRDWCKITSRRDLDTNTAAAERFAVLRTEFDAWRGRIARQQR